MLLSTGERISCALCAMAINDLGHRAISLTGSQAGIVTDTSHTKARILDVRADRIREALEEDFDRPRRGIPGSFDQPRRDDARPRRLGHDRSGGRRGAGGRGMRDLHRRQRRVHAPTRGSCRTPASYRSSASRRCSRWRRRGRRFCSCAQSSTPEPTASGIHCRSSFEDGPGTFVIGEDETMEHPLITAVTHSTEEARITLVGVPDRPGAAASIFTALADANVNVDTIVQNEPRTDGVDAEVSFTLGTEDVRHRRGRPRAGRRRSSVSLGSRPIPRSARSRSSAPGCARTRASPPGSSRCSPTRRSTSR